MAKAAKPSSSGPARIRFVILEAEIPDGDLSQVTQAVQNALRPVDGTGAVRRVIAGPTKLQSNSASASAEFEAADAEDVSEDVLQEEVQATAPSKRTRTFKPRSPNIIEVDLIEGEISFDDYAEKTKPDSHSLKNLVVAAWFKKYRKINEITMDHVYTCYRTVGWPAGMEDFGQPLRDLKKRKLMDGKGKGLYAINHVGLNEVTKIGG